MFKNNLPFSLSPIKLISLPLNVSLFIYLSMIAFITCNIRQTRVNNAISHILHQLLTVI